MTQLLVQITSFLPIFLASPTMYAGMLLVMRDEEQFRSRAFWAYIGCALTVAAIGIIILLVGGATPQVKEPTTLSGVINIALGVLLFIAGVRRYFRKPEPGKEKKKKERKPSAGESHLKFVGVGFLLTVTNPTSLASFLASIKLTIDSGLEISQQFIALSVAWFYFTLPILIPLLLAVFVPAASAKFLNIADHILKKYGRYIVLVFIFALAIYLVKKGIDILNAVP